MYFCGLDVGTSGVKAVVFDEKGNIMASSYEGYELVLKKDGTRDLMPDDMFSKIKAVLKTVGERCKGIEAIAVSSFGEAFLALDENDKPLCEVMLYTDRRGEDEYFEAMKKSSNDEIASICGLPPSPTYSISKLLYIKEQRPEVYAKAKRILLVQDFVNYMLSGEAKVDYSLACRTMLFDVHSKKWSDTLFEKFGMDKEKFSEPVQSGTIIGTILPGIAKELSLPETMKVVAGGHDQPVCAFGVGARKNSTVCSMGTTECMTPVFEKGIYLPNDVVNKLNYSNEPFITDKFCTIAYNPTSGILIKWFFDTFASAELENGKPPYGLFEKNAPDAPTNLFVQPYLMGSGAPYMDHRSRLSIMGVDIGTTRYDIYKGVLEGLCMEQRTHIEVFKKQGINIDSVVCVGGGTSSKLWLQTKADVLGAQVSTIQCSEAGALGCAMICAIAVGYYKDIEEARENMSALKDTYEPDMAKKAIYDEKYEIFTHLHSDSEKYSIYATR